MGAVGDEQGLSHAGNWCVSLAAAVDVLLGSAASTLLAFNTDTDDDDDEVVTDDDNVVTDDNDDVQQKTGVLCGCAAESL